MSDAVEARTRAQILADIEHTREGLAETAAALAERADVKARAQEKLDETKARLTEKVDEAKSRITGTAGAAKEKAADATPASVADGAQSAAGTVAEGARSNPLPVTLIVGFAAGVLIGWLIASRRD
jgi:ElaB/YqjD/DUF883 family membrane-anchored ribosome-binding protein